MTLVDPFAHDGLPPREQWPDLLIEPLGYPARLNCAVALLDDTIRAGHRDRPAFITDSETLSYGELGAKVDALVLPAASRADTVTVCEPSPSAV